MANATKPIVIQISFIGVLSFLCPQSYTFFFEQTIPYPTLPHGTIDGNDLSGDIRRQVGSEEKCH